jgi:hypothetical protein
MPIATIHVLEGRYDERRLGHVSSAVQDALISVLKIPSDDFFQVIHVLPRNRFLHSPSFLGLRYSDDLILLEAPERDPPYPAERTERADRQTRRHIA